jgi:hypothetical protein
VLILPYEGYSKQEILSTLQRYFEENDHFLSLNLYNEKRYKPSETTIRKKFGSWNQALKEAGLPINRTVDKRYSEEQLLGFLRSVSSNGIAPTVNDFRKTYHSPSVDTLISFFGSWNEAVRKAGLRENRILADEDEMLVRIRRFATEHPTNINSDHYEKVRWKPSYHAIKRRFGSWIHALEMAGITPPYRYFSNGDIIEELERCCCIVAPKRLTIPRYEALSGIPSVQTITRRFGSWDKALDAIARTDKKST